MPQTRPFSFTIPVQGGPPPTRRLLGGWRLPQPFARGGICCDFATGRLWMTGHRQRAEVLLYQLPAMGTGTDANGWPIVPITQVIPTWWGGSEGYYANGLCYWRGKVWAALQVYYDQAPTPDTTFMAQDGETFTIPIIRSQGAGFWKRGPGLDPLFGSGGGGGARSDKGVSMGPVLVERDGTVRIQYQWPQLPQAHVLRMLLPASQERMWKEYRESQLPGSPQPHPLDTPVSEPPNWHLRAPRPPNYWPQSIDVPDVHVDKWWAWEPREIVGRGLEGRWASDCLFDGGLILPEGYVCWPFMGTQEIDYRYQSWTFGQAVNDRTYQYTYDRTTYQFLRFEGDGTDPLPVLGQELDSAGRVYLSKGNAWSSNGMAQYTVDVAVHVYG